VSASLPYSIKRGEILAIPIIVFNYMGSDQAVDVTFFNRNGEFEFVDPTKDANRLNRERSPELQRVKRIFVKSNEGVSTIFMIKPLRVGHITIKVTANSSVAGDAVEKPLLVIPEGVTKFENEAVLVDLSGFGEFTADIDISIPANAVPDSTRIEVAATGDILVPSIENLDNLM
jgi:CD109 antigen